MSMKRVTDLSLPCEFKCEEVNQIKVAECSKIGRRVSRRREQGEQGEGEGEMDLSLDK